MIFIIFVINGLINFDNQVDNANSPGRFNTVNTDYETVLSETDIVMIGIFV